MYGKIIIIASIFSLGLYCMIKQPDIKESFGAPRCPDVLIQEGSKLSLFNSRIAKIPGVNPIQFENLNEYVDFTKWQRSQGIRCPVLYLQQAYDVQNNPVYKARPDPENTHAGAPDFNIQTGETGEMTKLLDATRDDPPYNTNSFPAYDQDNQDIGIETPLDKMFNSSKDGQSVNAMDTNWGGVKYSRSFFKPRTQ